MKPWSLPLVELTPDEREMLHEWGYQTRIGEEDDDIVGIVERIVSLRLDTAMSGLEQRLWRMQSPGGDPNTDKAWGWAEGKRDSILMLKEYQSDMCEKTNTTD